MNKLLKSFRMGSHKKLKLFLSFLEVSQSVFDSSSQTKGTKFKTISGKAQLFGISYSSLHRVTVGNWMFEIGAAIESIVVTTGFSAHSLNAEVIMNPAIRNPVVTIIS